MRFSAWFKRRRFEVTVRTLRGRVKTLSQIIGYFIITKNNLIKWSVGITPTTAMQCGGWNSTYQDFVCDIQGPFHAFTSGNPPRRSGLFKCCPELNHARFSIPTPSRRHRRYSGSTLQHLPLQPLNRAVHALGFDAKLHGDLPLLPSTSRLTPAAPIATVIQHG